MKGYDAEFVIGSKGADDLAELPAVLQIPVHFHHRVELEHPIDDRLEHAACEAPGDFTPLRPSGVPRRPPPAGCCIP